MARPDEQLIDARGLECPEPLQLARRLLERVKTGSVIRILATDPGAPIDFEAYCLNAGDDYLGSVRNGDCLEIRIRKGG